MSYLIGKSLGLESMTVNIVDNSYLSTYFNITEFNPNFGAGKNLLIVNTTPSLSANPNIQIEARDSNNNYLYIDSSKTIDPVSGKQTYYFSLYIYDNLSYGTGKITIVGVDSNNKTVKWSANILISPFSENKSKIVFFNKPKLNVFPLTTYGLSASVEINPKTLSGSFTSIAVYPPKDFDVNNNYNPNNLEYRIIDNQGLFQTGIESFPMTLYVNSIKTFNSSITQTTSNTSSILVKEVLNKNTILLKDPYIYQNNKITEVVSGYYECTFTNIKYNEEFFKTSSYLKETINLNGGTRPKKYSYALVGYNNLNTFSGYIQKHKIYKKNLSTAGDYELVTDEIFSGYELLKDLTTPNKSFEKIGVFYTQFHINNFWFTSSANFNLYSDNKIFLNGMVISGSDVSSGYTIAKVNTSYANRNSNYISFDVTQSNNFSGSAYDSNFLHFYPNSRYTLSLNVAFLNTTSSPTLNFYIKSNASTLKNEVGYDISKGKFIGSISSKSTKIYDVVQNLDFTFLNETYGTLVIYGSGFTSAVLANISLTPTNITGFSQDVYFTKVPFDVSKPNDIFEIKSELYDKDGNLAYSDLDTVQYFDPTGVTVPPSFSTIGNSLTITNISASTLTVNQILATNIQSTKLTGSLYGTSSWAKNTISSSYALTASYAMNAGGSGGNGSGFATTGSNIFTGSQIISGSLDVLYGITGSLYGTSSWSINSITSSYIDAGNITTGILNNNVLPTQMNVTNITASSTAIFQGDFIFDKGYGIVYTNTQVTGSTIGATTASLYNLTFGNTSASVYMHAIVTGYDTGSRSSISGDIKSTIKYQNGQVTLIGPNTLFINSETPATFNVLTGSISASLLVYGVISRTYNWGATISTQIF